MSTLMLGDPTPEPRPRFPELGRYYRFTSDLAYLIVRVTAGLMLVPHWWAKVAVVGIDRVTANMAGYGLPAPRLFAILAIVLEIAGSILITIGAFTRPIAALLVVEFLIIIFVAHWPKGFAVSAGGIEYPLFWGLILLAILLRGGGPWSVDRKLGWEV